jgi:hypothetical protein
LQSRCLRPLVAGALDQAKVSMNIARERLPRCVTHYSRSRLRYYLADVPNRCSRLKESAGRPSLERRGRDRFDNVAKTLSETLRTLGAVCSNDVAHEEEVLALRADRDQLALEGAQRLVGIARREFLRLDDQVRQNSLAFERSRDLPEVNRCLKELRRSVSHMELLLEKHKRLEAGVCNATATFNALDRRAVAGDPRSDEVFVQTAQLLESLREGSGHGELDRGLALLQRASQNLDILALHVDQVRRDAATEVELWRRIVSICPRVALAFADDLAKTSLEPSGDSLAAWVVLRRRIEIAVARAASETRSANASALHDRALGYQWRDPSKRRLRAFAKYSFRLWQSSVHREDSAAERESA